MANNKSTYKLQIIFLIFAIVLYIPINGWSFDLIFDWKYYFKAVPFLLLFLTISWLSNVVIGLSISALITELIICISELKSKTTGIPLRYHDLINFQHISIIKDYIDIKLILIIIALCVCLVVFSYSLIKNIKNIKNNKIKSIFIKNLIIFSLAVFTFYPVSMGDYLNNLNSEKIYDLFNIKYIRWEDNVNIKNNGIYFHLIFTAQIKNIKKYSNKEFDSELIENSELIKGKEVNKIIYILCESCWSDNGDKFDKILTSTGFKSTRMISPVFGGGTANTEFEVLTALPVRNLTGIVFQEYGELISHKIISINSILKDKNYHTALVQGSSKKLWNGETVYPKLGFEEVISDEEIGFSLDSKNDDKLIFKKILNLIDNNDKIFVIGLTQHTHGPFKDNGDEGDSDYEQKLQNSYLNISNLKKILDYKYKENYLLVVFGDHRPGGLSKNYYLRSNFTTNMLDFLDMNKNNAKEILKNKFNVLDSWDIIGDVPVFYSGSLSSELSGSLYKKNIYCLSPIVLRDLHYSMDKSWNKFLENCNSYNENKLEHWKKYPDKIYYRNLFSD